MAPDLPPAFSSGGGFWPTDEPSGVTGAIAPDLPSAFRLGEGFEPTVEPSGGTGAKDVCTPFRVASQDILCVTSYVRRGRMPASEPSHERLGSLFKRTAG